MSGYPAALVATIPNGAAHAVEARGLRKSYGSLEAVRGVDITVTTGEVFALLGPNGAGKTTIVEILEGHRARSAGHVRVLGFDPQRGERTFRERIGIVLQSTGVEPYLTVEEAVELYRGYYPHPRALDEIIDVVGLTERRHERVIRLSGGLQRRLDVAIGLAGDPDLLFLDEPTTGFDPGARRSAWGMIRNLAELGKTVFLTTHYMDEAQALASRVAIIQSGLIVAEGTPETIAGRKQDHALIAFRMPKVRAKLPKTVESIANIRGDRVEVRTDAPTAVLAELTTWAVKHKKELEDLHVTRPSLEDVYLRLVGEEAGA